MQPLDSLLDKAAELSGRADDWTVETDPYVGLVAERPVRALSALTKSAERSEYPEWAWRIFLSAEARKSDKPRLSALIAERIFLLPEKSNSSVHTSGFHLAT